jgi:8-oxo-dGTP pyrophosphatase MutT (NUDIX family)
LAAAKEPQQALIEHSAGGVVFKQAPHGLQIALIKDPFGHWTFAKGHVEPGETLEETSVRETQEEMGLRSLRVVARLGTIELWFTERYRSEIKGRTVHKYVHYFLLQAAPGAFGNTHGDKKIQGMTWVPLDQVVSRSSYKDTVPILQRALRLLRKKEQDLRARGVIRTAATSTANQNPAAK